MKLRAFAVVVVALALTSAGEALAQCSFDGPAKAKGFSTSLIRAFSPCPCISPCPPFPNSQTGTGVPSCAPPYAFSSYEFDTPGRCSFKMYVRHEMPCSNGNPEACTAPTFLLRCSRILDPGGATRTNAPGFQVTFTVRSTMDDPGNGDMTVINFPFNVVLPAAVDGQLYAKFGLADLPFMDLVTPGCAELEILNIALLDPSGARFAVVGAGTRPRGF